MFIIKPYHGYGVLYVREPGVSLTFGLARRAALRLLTTTAANTDRMRAAAPAAAPAGTARKAPPPPPEAGGTTGTRPPAGLACRTVGTLSCEAAIKNKQCESTLLL
eukprot:8445274-Pyramimonas_sp.AAC.1